MLRPDGPFIAVPQLTEAFPQYLDEIEDSTLNRLRLAWSEVTEAPDTLTPAWTDLVLRELLGYTGQVLGEGPSLPADLVSGPGVRPDGVVYGPDGSGGRAERLYLYRRPYDESLTTATRHQLSPAEQAAALCRDRGVPLALLTNGAHWVLVHARPNEPHDRRLVDADLWLEERDLLRAFSTLLRAPFVAAGRLAELFAKSAAAAGRGHRHARHPGPPGRGAPRRRAVPAEPRVRLARCSARSSRARSTGARSPS